MQIFSLAFTLFLLMDSVGNIPIFLSVLKDQDKKKKGKIIFRELLIALGIILVFSLIGNHFLNFLDIRHYTVEIAGGIILFLIALKMIFPTGIADPDGKNKLLLKDPFIVPLATPLIAGPAVLAAVMLYAHHEVSYSVAIPAIIIAWVFTAIILLASSFLQKVLGFRGLIACERLMGLILTLISIQMFLRGIHGFSITCHA